MGRGDGGPRPAEWAGVIRAIEAILPTYERINRAATFYLLPLWRERVAAHSRGMEAVLEIGPGPGSFSALLGGEVTCVDPSLPILSYARGRVDGGRHRFAGGMAEALPFRDGSFDGVFCAFAFRDFLDKRQALREMRRVLRPGGETHILEIAPPPPGWRRQLLGTWIEKGVPVLARVLAPPGVRSRWRGNPYWHFTETYRAMDAPEDEAAKMARAGFQDVAWEYLGAEAVFHLKGVSPRTT